MKIQKVMKYIPIKITLETPEEADVFWDAVENSLAGEPLTTEQRKLLNKISNSFSEYKVI